jgi:hypothetical protein
MPLGQGGFDPTQTLIGSAGVAGVWVLAFIFGQIYSAKSVIHEREAAKEELTRALATAEADRVRDEQELARRQALIDTLLAVYHNEILPTLSDYEKKLAPALARTEDVLKKMEWIISEYERRSRGFLAEEESPYYGRRATDSRSSPSRRSDADYGARSGERQGSGPGVDPPPQGSSQ